jgi:hypothetical protein
MGKKTSVILRAGGLVLSLAGAAIKAYFEKTEREKLIQKEVEKVLKNQKPNI